MLGWIYAYVPSRDRTWWPYAHESFYFHPCTCFWCIKTKIDRRAMEVIKEAIRNKRWYIILRLGKVSGNNKQVASFYSSYYVFNNRIAFVHYFPHMKCENTRRNLFFNLLHSSQFIKFVFPLYFLQCIFQMLSSKFSKLKIRYKFQIAVPVSQHFTLLWIYNVWNFYTKITSNYARSTN